MSSAKSCPRVGSGGVQRLTTGSHQQVGWPSIGGAPRLSKAKSSPNVSRPTPTPRPSIARIDESRIGQQSRKSPTASGIAKSPTTTTGKSSPGRSATSARSPGNVTIVQITRDESTRSASVGKPIGAGSASRSANGPSSLTKSESKRRAKDGTSMSCTILEDRALLKKGLSCGPEKLPRKPDAVRKRCLSRSTSLWNVPVDTERLGDTGGIGKRAYRQSTGSMEPSKKEGRCEKSCGIAKSNLNRTTSMWNVPSDGTGCPNRMSRARSVTGLRPSRIPLLTQHIGSQSNLGVSLADLTSVDRYAVKLRPRIVDFDEIDGAPKSANDSWENRPNGETPKRRVVSEEPNISTPIYENLKAVDSPIDDDKCPKAAGTNSGIAEIRTAYDLEKRVAELMAELDDDDDEQEDERNGSTVVHEETKRTTNGRGSNDESSTRVAQNSFAIKDHRDGACGALRGGRSIAKSQESLPSRREPEMSIQEIRKNWEKQIRRCQMSETPDSKGSKPVTCGTPRINSATVNLTKKSPENETRKSVGTPNRTKDIGHLVNFFNCKNTDVPKDNGIHETWPKMKEATTATIVDHQANIIKKAKEEKSNGYASDGNCSEDSGHMSNENDVEWKEESPHRELKGLQKSEIFLKEIIRDLDSSLERTIEVFDAAPIVQRFPTDETKKRTLKSSISTSSGASSIDSWEETTKSAKRVTSLGRFEDNSTPGPTPSTQVKRSHGEITGEQIFFRSGALERLESQRDEKLTGHIILLQARCRGYLARRKLNTLKLQDLAVRCIQRNVRKLMSVREWPWWRLYVKVAPLLNVHRTEDQLKARTEELEVLRAKVERLEQERNHLKHDNDKLEAKVSSKPTPH